MDLILLFYFFFFSSRRRHTRSLCDWSSDVCSSDLVLHQPGREPPDREVPHVLITLAGPHVLGRVGERVVGGVEGIDLLELEQRAVRERARLVHLPALEQRSEERRVGKECRSRWWRCQ